MRTTILFAFIFLYTQVYLLFPGEIQSSEIYCYRVKDTPFIDGLVKEDVWRKGDMLRHFNKLSDNMPSALPNAAIILYNDEKLYISAFFGKKINATMHKNFWRDGIEIFIDPGRTSKSYFQIAGGLNGTWSAAYRADSGQDTGWKPEMEFVAGTLAGGWLLEMAISFSSLGLTPREGDTWGMNVCRNDSSERFITFAPLEKGFHEPFNFSKLRFKGHKKTGALAARGNSADSFKKTLKHLYERLANLPKASSAKEYLEKRLEFFRGKSEEANADALKNPVFSDIYREWIYSSMLNEVNDSVYWQLMIVQLLEK